MTCPDARRAMQTADRAELRAEGGSVLAIHLRGCSACRAAAIRLEAGTDLLAEMVASRLFNKQKGHELPCVYGIVTTGSLWKFLKLEGDVVSHDQREYPISELARVIGILVSMLSVDDPH